MITLNLLPPDKKEEVIQTRIYIIIKNFIIFILFLISLIAISLIASRLILQTYFKQIVEDYTLTTKYVSLFSNETNEFNNQVKIVDEIKASYVPWNKFYYNLFQLVPLDTKFKTLIINSNTITITGKAETRNALLKLKENLENSEIFFEIEVPIADLLKKINLDFNIKAKIDFSKI